MRHFSYLVAALAVSAISAAGAAERAYPIKPIRLISPFAPGGGNDTMARAVGGKLAEAWGHQVVVDNRPGANGILACEITAKASPDGYTLLMANAGSHGINPALYRKLPYDAVKDYTRAERHHEQTEPGDHASPRTARHEGALRPAGC